MNVLNMKEKFGFKNITDSNFISKRDKIEYDILEKNNNRLASLSKTMPLYYIKKLMLKMCKNTPKLNRLETLSIKEISPTIPTLKPPIDPPPWYRPGGCGDQKNTRVEGEQRSGGTSKKYQNIWT